MSRFIMTETDSSSVLDTETNMRIPLQRATIDIIHLRQQLFSATIGDLQMLFVPDGETDVLPDEATERRVAIVQQPSPDNENESNLLVVALETKYAEERVIDCTPMIASITEK